MADGEGGRAIVSFLEFRIPCHWETFIVSVNAKPGWLWIQFVDRDAITAWASHSGLVVESFFDGDKPHIPIPEEIRMGERNLHEIFRKPGPVGGDFARGVEKLARIADSGYKW